MAPSVLDRLGAFPDDIQEVFRLRLERLADNPRRPEARCLSEPHEVYHLRVDDSTIVYRLYDTVQLIYVTRVGWRGLAG